MLYLICIQSIHRTSLGTRPAAVYYICLGILYVPYLHPPLFLQKDKVWNYNKGRFLFYFNKFTSK